MFSLGDIGVPLVRLPKQALQAQEDTLYVVNGTPLIFQDVETDTAREVDIRMVDGRLEEHSRWGVRIVVRKSERELEGQVFIGGLGRSGDGGRPGKEVAIGVRKCRNARGRREHKLHQFGLEATESSEVSTDEFFPFLFYVPYRLVTLWLSFFCGAEFSLDASSASGAEF
jgi:hypothetical protein